MQSSARPQPSPGVVGVGAARAALHAATGVDFQAAARRARVLFGGQQGGIGVLGAAVAVLWPHAHRAREAVAAEWHRRVGVAPVIKGARERLGLGVRPRGFVGCSGEGGYLVGGGISPYLQHHAALQWRVRFLTARQSGVRAMRLGCHMGALSTYTTPCCAKGAVTEVTHHTRAARMHRACRAARRRRVFRD